MSIVVIVVVTNGSTDESWLTVDHTKSPTLEADALILGAVGIPVAHMRGDGRVLR